MMEAVEEKVELKRYPEYKDSGVEWLGKLPSHWKIEKGKWLFKEEDRPTREEDEVVTCFRDGEVTLRSNRRTDGFTNSLKEHGYQGIRKGDLVIHNMDAFAGAIGVSDSDGKSTPVYSACTPLNQNEVSPEYYAYFLRDLALSGFIESLAKGIRERSTDFRFSNFGELLLAFPPKEEQTAIAHFLDRKTEQIDQAIEIKQKQIELLKERRQILIHKAVTRGLNPDVPLKPSGVEWIGDIPEHWEVKKIKYVTSKIGSGITPSGGATTYIEDGIPLLRSQNIHFGRIDFSDVAYISESTHNSMSNSQVKQGDVLLNITGGSLGRCHYVVDDREMNVNQHVCILRPTEDIQTVYLNGLIASKVGQGQIWFYQQGGGREGLNFQAIKNFFLPLPPVSEQIEISKKVDEVSTSIFEAVSEIELQIKKLKEYKTTLINSAVTGKIKVS